jgi:hypothetical protein
MSMPKGAKIKCGYATVEGGGDYRMIADVMTKKFGFKMNHSSARNHFLSVMRGLAEDFLRVSGAADVTQAAVEDLARQPMFQSAIRDVYENFLQEEARLAA